MIDTSYYGPFSSRPMRRARASLPCLLLALGASACGDRFELGELGARELQLSGPPKDVTLSGTVVLDGSSDADAQLAPIPDPGSDRGAAFIDAVIPAGDMDGDGYDDAVVQHFLTTPASLDHVVRIVYGGPRPTDGVIAIEPGISFGLALRYQHDFRVSPAGDVNGDGLADLFVTTGVTYLTWPPAGWVNEYGTGPEPAAYLLYGSAERTSSLDVVPLTDVAVAFTDRDDIGRDVEDEIFFKTISLNALGDIDGDGFDDFTLTTSVLAEQRPEENDRTGLDPLPRGSATYLFYGQSEPFASGAASQQPSAKLAGVLAAEPLGDVDGDGLGDALLSGDDLRILPGARGRRSGDVSAAASLRVDIVPPFVPSTELPVAVGDLDQDGYADFMLRRDLFEGTGDDVHGRFSYLVYGGPGLLDGALGTNDASAIFDPRGSGWLWPAGDWDGDGYPDLHFFHYTWVEGQLYGEVAKDELLLLQGSADRFSGVFEAPLLGTEDEPGASIEVFSLARLGDLDGDGFADLAFQADAAAGRQPLFVTYGRPLPPPPIR